MRSQRTLGAFGSFDKRLIAVLFSEARKPQFKAETQALNGAGSSDPKLNKM